MESEKLYSPVEFYLHNHREEEANGEYGMYDLYDERYKISSYDAAEYQNAVELAVLCDRERMNPIRGMAEYLHGSLERKVESLFPSIEYHGELTVCAAGITLSEPLTSEEMAELKDWWSGQLSDGWGEGFEQRGVKVGREELYIVPWTPDDSFFIDTGREFQKRLWPDRLMPGEVTSAVCINGELKPGDLVISIPGEDYACLVGTVLEINKAGTPEHDAETENLEDSVHVNFIDAEYSRGRIKEIEEMFSHLYGMPKTFEECPIDDTIMVPDVLIRITGIDRDTLQSILDSETNAAAFCDGIINGLDMADGKNAPDMSALYDKLDHNFADSLTAFRAAAANQSITDDALIKYAENLAAVNSAYHYLKHSHDFEDSDFALLVKCDYPLDVVAEAWPDIAGYSDIREGMRNFFEAGDYIIDKPLIEPIKIDTLDSGHNTDGPPSVIDKIREAAKAPKKQRVDKSARDKPGPEH